MPQSNGNFVLTFESQDEVRGGQYTLRYIKAENKLELISTVYDSKTGKPREMVTKCEIDDTVRTQISSGHEGKYVSKNGKYTVEIDAEGNLKFNGTQVRLKNGSFMFDNCLVQTGFTGQKLHLRSLALGIDDDLTKVEEE